MRRVNQLFGGDPVLAAQLMQCANSSAFKWRGRCGGLRRRLCCSVRASSEGLLKKAELGLTVRATAGIDMAQFARISHATAKLAGD